MPDCLTKTSMTIPHKSNLTYFISKSMLISVKHTFEDWLVLIVPSLPQNTEHSDKGVYTTTRHQGPWIPLAHILLCLSHKTPHHYKLNTILLLYYLKPSMFPHSLNMKFKCIKHDPLNYHPYFPAAPRVKPLLTSQTCCPFKLSLTFSETLTDTVPSPSKFSLTSPGSPAHTEPKGKT